MEQPMRYLDETKPNDLLKKLQELEEFLQERNMEVRGMTGAGWFEIVANGYSVRIQEEGSTIFGACGTLPRQIESEKFYFQRINED
jgi:hypothetical protein